MTSCFAKFSRRPPILNCSNASSLETFHNLTAYSFFLLTSPSQTGSSCSVAQAGLKLMATLLFRAPHCWNCMCEPLCPALFTYFSKCSLVLKIMFTCNLLHSGMKNLKIQFPCIQSLEGFYGSTSRNVLLMLLGGSYQYYRDSLLWL